MTVKPLGGCWYFVFALVVFCLGFGVGVVATGLASWGFWYAYEDAIRNPLAGLSLPDHHLTLEQAKPFVDRFANDYLATPGNRALVIGITCDHQQQFFTYGEISETQQIGPDEDTVFEIASVGKTFTTAVLADMFLRGELDIHEPLQKFLPDGEVVPTRDGKHISLADLATHSSGLPTLPPGFETHIKDPLNPYADYGRDQLFRDLPKIKLPYPIGSQYEYSNLGMGLLGIALEHRSGTPYEQLIIERLCKPLGLASTRITLDEALQARVATPHDGGEPVPIWEDNTLPGAGSFLTSARDLLKFVEAHWSGTTEPIEKALQLCIKKRRRAGSSSESIGLGWHVTSENAVDLVWHNGGSGGSASYAGFMPEYQIGVVVIANSSNTVDEIGIKILYLLHHAREPVLPDD